MKFSRENTSFEVASPLPPRFPRVKGEARFAKVGPRLFVGNDAK